MNKPTTARRLAWLLACIAAGAVVGFAGHAWTAQAYWFLAIPAAVAVGWLFLADPTACEPPARGSRSGDGHQRER